MATRNSFRALDDIIAIPGIVALLDTHRAKSSILETIYNHALTPRPVTVTCVGHKTWTVKSVARRRPAIARETRTSEREVYAKPI